jgi:diguanylate cyclase (GGDEF)-like protein
MPTLDNQEVKDLLTYSAKFHEFLRLKLIDRLNNSLSNLSPSLPNDLLVQTTEIIQLLNGINVIDPVFNEKSGENTSLAVEDKYNNLLSRIVLHYRKALAHDLEHTRTVAIHPETHDKLDAKLKEVEKYTRTRWFNANSATRVPPLSEYLNAKEIDLYIRADRLCLQERQYDEKFHLLLSPSLFVSDMNYYMQVGELKGAEMCVGYIDIDDFKSFNKELGGESVVDRIFLPAFMRYVDSYFSGHGHTYRYGGDEYVVILPFITRELAGQFFSGLLRGLKSIKIDGVSKEVTLSIGLFHFPCNTHFLPSEIEKFANEAKTYAKKNGKHCIYFYDCTGLSGTFTRAE